MSLTHSWIGAVSVGSYGSQTFLYEYSTESSVETKTKSLPVVVPTATAIISSTSI